MIPECKTHMKASINFSMPSIQLKYIHPEIVSLGGVALCARNLLWIFQFNSHLGAVYTLFAPNAGKLVHWKMLCCHWMWYTNQNWLQNLLQHFSSSIDVYLFDFLSFIFFSLSSFLRTCSLNGEQKVSVYIMWIDLIISTSLHLVGAIYFMYLNQFGKVGKHCFIPFMIAIFYFPIFLSFNRIFSLPWHERINFFFIYFLLL